MKITARGSLERLVAGDHAVLGAAFCSFTFEPAFFEDHVLRAVLRVDSDPVEQPARFYEEVRRVLQEVPVACIVDARARSPGQRLPYDLLGVHTRVHHPKLALLLFDEGARLGVGSGNLTRRGFGDNAELFFVQDLPYEDPASAEVLRAVDRFLTADLVLAPHRGTQMDGVLRILRGKIETTPRTDAAPVLFVDTFSGAILDTILGLVPSDARVTRAGILAPFLEQDDADASDLQEITSVLGRLTSVRQDKDFVLDLGTIWDQNALERPAEIPGSLDAGMGRLWIQRAEEEDRVQITFATLREATTKTVDLTDALGEARRRPRKELEAALADGRLWPIHPIVVHAPARILEAAQSEFSLALWLHPSWRIEAGKPVHRPLHAKLITLTTKRRGKTSTLVYVGSANASRRALLRDVAAGGNVECGVVFRIDDAISIMDLAADLVNVDPSLVSCHDRTFAAAQPNLARCIERAIHDAAARTLTITFAKGATLPAQWSMTYDGEVIASGGVVPEAPLLREAFTLRAHCCELALMVGDAFYPVPITVLDLAALPPSAALTDLSLRELLALLGARVGRERLATIRAERGRGGMRPVLDALFGEGFGPNDVFRAFRGSAQELSDPSLSLAGFRARLAGALGVGALWKQIRGAVSDAFEAAPDESLSRDEAWFYGAELSRTLGTLVVPEGKERKEKQGLLDAFVSSLQADLEGLRPTEDRRGWVQRICAFYAIPRREETTS